MGQAAELTELSVSNDTELWQYLAEQPIEVTQMLAYRAALRALRDVALFEQLDEATARYTMTACRAVLTTGVVMRRPDDALSEAARALVAGPRQMRLLHRRFMADDAMAADAMVRVISALEAVLTDDPERAADLAGHAMAGDPACYEDCTLCADEMLKAPIDCAELPEGRADQLAASEDWAFWRAWHGEAMGGRHVSWMLQADVARLPDDVWDSAPAVVAARIGRAFARLELVGRIELLERRMNAQPGVAPDPDTPDEEPGDEHASAGFAAIRLIRGPLTDLIAQCDSPKPQPFLIQKASARLTTVLAASGKWLGRSAEGDIKDMVRLIGKGGGVATASWIEQQAPQIRAVIRAADDWRHRLPA